MIVFANFHRLFGDTSPLFSERKGAEIRNVSIKQFGITPTVLPEHCTAYYGVLRVEPSRDRQVFFDWLRFIEAEAVSIEQADLAVLVPDKVVRTGMMANWKILARELDKIPSGDLYESLESAALKVFVAQPVQVSDADSRFVRDQQEQQSLADLKAAGLKDPLEEYDRYDEAKARAVAAYQAREDQKTNAFMGIEESESTHMTLQDQVRAAREQVARQNQDF